MTFRLKIGGWLMVVLMVACTAPPVKSRAIDAFVERTGHEFTLQGHPYRFMGTNAAIMHGPVARENMPALLRGIADLGLRVVRVWALGEQDGDEPWRQQFAFRVRSADGQIHELEAGLEHLDQLLVEARRQKLRVLITLSNHWADYGGWPQYLRWVGVEPRGRLLRSAERVLFWTHADVVALYQAHLGRLLERVNSVSGEAYRNDPTIFAWELVNEGTANSCRGVQAFEQWISDQVAFVRERDPNHLIGAGHGGYVSELGRGMFIAAMQHADYADTHAYFTYHAYVESPEHMARWLIDRVHLAQRYERPLIIGEIGFAPAVPLHNPRAEWFRAFFETARQMGVSGVLPWIVRTKETQRTRHGIYLNNDDNQSAEVRESLQHAAATFDGPLRTPIEDPPQPFPMDLGSIAPTYIEDHWQAVDGEWRLDLETSAFDEACTNEEVQAAYLLWPIATSRDFDRWRLDLSELAEAQPLLNMDLRLSVDNQPALALQTPIVQIDTPLSSGWHWLRLEAESEAGRLLLEELVTAMPDERAIVVFGHESTEP